MWFYPKDTTVSKEDVLSACPDYIASAYFTVLGSSFFITLVRSQ